MKKMDINIQKVTNIIHLADIHIRLYKRSSEYQIVFNNLYKQLSELKNDTTIIMVLGDIAHSKNEMSPEMVHMTADFLKNLADIMPTIVVLGNHDANINNTDRLDAISPIVNTLNHKNLILFKNSDIYTLRNIAISNMSVFDPVEDYIKADKIDDKYIKIATYHGVVDSALTDSGFALTSERMKTSFFDGFDMVLLGDIHKKQDLQLYSNTSGIKKPLIVYPGSLIQQNYAESVDNHGFLYWDVNKRSYKFYEVENPYGYVTVTYDNGKIDWGSDRMPQKPKIRIKAPVDNKFDVTFIAEELKNKYNPIELKIVREKIDSVKNTEHEHTTDFSNIKHVDFQNELLSEFINNKYHITDEQMEVIYEMNRKFNSMLPTETLARNVIWKPKVFEFSNMFSYGEDNIVDFSKMNGLVGLFASNASGKTSLINAFTFCLFDRCDKAFKAAQILNKRKKEFKCKLNFEIDGIDYFVERHAKPSSNGVTVKVDFYKLDEFGNIISLNGEQRRDTDSVIKSYVGTYEDFILTSLSSQQNSENFVDKTQSERKDLLAQFLDITIIDKLNEIAGSELKEYVVLLKEYEKSNTSAEMDANEMNKRNYKRYLKEKLEEKSNIQDKYNGLNAKYLELNRSLIPLNGEYDDIDVLNKNKNTLQTNANEMKETYDKLLAGFDVLKTKKAELETEMSEYDIDTIKFHYEKINSLKRDHELESNKLEIMKSEFKTKLEKTKKLRDLKYDENCEYCMNNVFVIDAIETKKIINSEFKNLEEYKNKVNKIQSDIDELSEYKTLYDEYSALNENYQELMKKYNTVEVSIANGKNKILSTLTQLKEVNEKIKAVQTMKESIAKNKETNSEMEKVKTKMDAYDVKLNEVNSEIENAKAKLIYFDEKTKTLNEYVEKMIKMEQDFKLLEYYVDATKRDSIPYNLIKKAIPFIEEEANNILSQIVDFTLSIQLNGKNVDAFISYDDDRTWLIELSSGMERFITGIAMRDALRNISNLPKSNFFMIDEGFSALDADNISSLPYVLDYMNSKYDFIFTISHIDQIRDFVNMTLNLQMVDGYSKIEF